MPNPAGVRNFDYSTGEYINQLGKRTLIRGMSDEHLSNAMDYLKFKYGSSNATEAQRQMEKEQFRRLTKKQRPVAPSKVWPKVLYNKMPAGLEYRIDDRIPPGQIIFGDGTGELSRIINLNCEGDNMTATPDTLFEVAILQETKNEDKTTTTELVYGPEPIVAKDSERAKLIAVQRAFAGDTKIDPANIRISVRLFGTFQ